MADDVLACPCYTRSRLGSRAARARSTSSSCRLTSQNACRQQVLFLLHLSPLFTAESPVAETSGTVVHVLDLNVLGLVDHLSSSSRVEWKSWK